MTVHSSWPIDEPADITATVQNVILRKIIHVSGSAHIESVVLDNGIALVPRMMIDEAGEWRPCIGVEQI